MSSQEHRLRQCRDLSASLSAAVMLFEHTFFCVFNAELTNRGREGTVQNKSL